MDDAAASRRSPPDPGRDALYRRLVESITDYAICMLDPQGRVSSWNAGAQRFKCYAAAEIVGAHFSRFYTDEDRAQGLPARALATALDEGKFEGEGWRVRRDGSRFWAHVVIDTIRGEQGELLGYAEITRDLSERRAADEALKRTQEQFRLLVQGVTDYAIYMLDTEGRVSSWNAGAQRIKGYREDEVLGQHFGRFYREEDRAAGLPQRALRRAEAEGRFEGEGWRVRRDGGHFWAHVVIDPIRDDAGRILGFAKITRDVTDQRAAQHDLERARESLFQSQKLDALGQLTGGVAHDFNNLLMVILSSLEMIRRRVGGDPQVAGLIDNAMRGARRGASLTQRMLSFARRQELKPAAVDVPALLHGMSELLRRSLGPGITIALPAPRAMSRVRVDANQLELALLNLAVNARDAMPRGGVIGFEVAEMEGPEPPKPMPGPWVRIGVADQGEGMDEATLARATEPFFTTKGVGKGTGLGLSMVHGLATQSGGQFQLRSAPGQGTTAALWLPVAEGEDEAASGFEVSRPPQAWPPLRVLAVDDDGLVLSNTVSLLQELGHEVLAAGSADEALAQLRRGPPVQLLLTDHAMPHKTGAELIAEAAQAWPAMAAILATGYAELRSELPPGVQRLAKPFGLQDLSQAIAEAMERAAASPR